MIAINTNILIQYITQSDLEDTKHATQMIEQQIGQPQSIFINNITLCEFVKVLESNEQCSKEQIIKILRQIFSTTEFTFENHSILWNTLDEYSQNDENFSNILSSAINQYFLDQTN